MWRFLEGLGQMTSINAVSHPSVDILSVILIGEQAIRFDDLVLTMNEEQSERSLLKQ